MDDVTLVHVIPRDRLILLEPDSGLLIPLLVVFNPERRQLGPGIRTKDPVTYEGVI